MDRGTGNIKLQVNFSDAELVHKLRADAHLRLVGLALKMLSQSFVIEQVGKIVHLPMPVSHLWPDRAEFGNRVTQVNGRCDERLIILASHQNTTELLGAFKQVCHTLFFIEYVGRLANEIWICQVCH